MQPKLRVRQFKRAVMQQTHSMLPGSPPERRVLPRALHSHSRDDPKAADEDARHAHARVAANEFQH
jgi:hypothetical protein